MTTVLTTTSTKIEVQSATMAELVAFYNANSGKAPIKKFETRAKGVDRCLGMLAKEPANLPDETRGQRNARLRKDEAAPSAMSQMAKITLNLTGKPGSPILKIAKKPETKSAAKKPASPTNAVRGKAHFSLDGVITIVHKGDNPKRAAAADRYDLYRNGMTVAAYIAAGGQRRDVVWDQKQGWIKVAG